MDDATETTASAPRVVDADPGRCDRASVCLTVRAVHRALEVLVPVTLTSDRAGLVMETNAKVKLRGVQVGRVADDRRRQASRSRLTLEIDPDQIAVHPGQRRGADPRHHGVRRQVRRPGLSRAIRAHSGWKPAQVLQFAQCQHRGQHGVRERRRRAQPDRSGQAQRGAVRGGRRRPRTGRADRPGHHRRQ